MKSASKCIDACRVECSLMSRNDWLFAPIKSNATCKQHEEEKSTTPPVCYTHTQTYPCHGPSRRLEYVRQVYNHHLHPRIQGKSDLNQIALRYKCRGCRGHILKALATLGLGVPKSSIVLELALASEVPSPGNKLEHCQSFGRP